MPGKAQRLKEAKEEAGREIEDYRRQRESQFQEQQKKSAGSKDNFAQKMHEETQTKLAQLDTDIEKNKEVVMQRLFDLIYDIKPEVHRNLRLSEDTK